MPSVRWPRAPTATVTIVAVPVLPGSIVANGSVTGDAVEVDMTNNATATTTTVTAAPKTTYVSLTDGGFAPAVVKPAQNTTVQWDTLRRAATGVVDASRMQLFGSPPLNPPAYYPRFKFVAAGSYPVTDAAAAHTSTVTVPVKSVPTGTVGVPVTLIWSAIVAPAGFVYDVQAKAPGENVFTTWKLATTANWPRGTRRSPASTNSAARFRKLAVSGGNCSGHVADACTGWSPVRKLTVS